MSLFPKEISPAFITFIVTIALILVVCVLIARAFKRVDIENNNSIFLGTVEYVLDYVHDFVKSFVGEKHVNFFTPLALTLFFIVFIGNVLAIFSFREIALDLNIPLALALMMFVLWTGFGIRKVGIKKYLHEFIEPHPLMLPLELLGTFTKPLAMAVRMFGNILSGYIILEMIWSVQAMLLTLNSSNVIFNIFGYVGGALIVGVVGILQLYFSIFAPFIQAVVFMSLTLASVSMFTEQE
ncbi:MAG: F0F1 ATP synthase subunit A [Mycoplasmatales bacterium]